MLSGWYHCSAALQPKAKNERRRTGLREGHFSAHVFEGSSHLELAVPAQTCIEHNEQIFQQRLRCDTVVLVQFAATDGTPLFLEWDAHRPFLQAGSCVMDKHINPGGSPPDTIYLNYHPMLFDRLVHFIYTGNYKLDAGGAATKFYAVSKVPDGYVSRSFAMEGIPYMGFHVAMYRLGEELDYPALKKTAFSKMVEHAIARRRCTPKDLNEMVHLVYNIKFCDDNDNRLTGLVVAAVVVYERKVWAEAQLMEFEEGVKHIAQFMMDWGITVRRHGKILADELKNSDQKGKKRKIVLSLTN